MCVWIWVSSRRPTDADRRKRVDRPVEVLVPAVRAQRQALADRRLVDLDDLDARGLEVRDLVADRERELLAGLRARLVVAHERPHEHRHRAGEHALDRLVRERLGVLDPVRPSSRSGATTSPKMIGGRT